MRKIGQRQFFMIRAVLLAFRLSGRGADLRGLGGLGIILLIGLCLPAAVRAATFTPSLNTQMGYTDNVRTTDSPQGDAFVTISPGFKLETGRPSNRLVAAGDLNYSHYYRLSEYTQIEGGNLFLAYLHQLSAKTQVQMKNVLSSTYDAPVEQALPAFGAQPGLPDQISAPTGREPRELVRVRTKGGRRDQNTTTVQGQHRFGPHDLVYAGYSYIYTQNTDAAAEDSRAHLMEGGGAMRLAPHWRAEANLSGTRTDYDKSDGVDRYRANAALVNMLGPKKEASLRLGYEDIHSEANDPGKSQARSYKIYDVALGYTHQASPALNWGLSAGWSTVEGDKQANQAAGDNFPTFHGWLTYKGKRFTGTIYGQHSLGEYDIYGDNSGLTLSSRVGVNFSYQLAQHWTLNLMASYIRDNYKQDPALAGTDQSGNVDTLLAGLALSWQFTRHAWLSLDYRFLDTDGEFDKDDRRQNRVLLMLTVENPYRW